MSLNPKILLNRVKKGKKLSIEDEKTLLNHIDNGSFTLEYASCYRQERWIEFEEDLEDYCERFGLFSINRNYLMIYIKSKIKGPWNNIQKYLNDDLKVIYCQYMIELGFEEYAI